MNEDAWLFVVVFVVWLGLAVVYAAVPMFSMPGYAVVWGWGAVVFLGLAALLGIAMRRGRRRRGG